MTWRLGTESAFAQRCASVFWIEQFEAWSLHFRKNHIFTPSQGSMVPAEGVAADLSHLE